MEHNGNNMETVGRVRALQNILSENGIDLAAFSPGPVNQYLTDSRADWREQIDLQPSGGDVFVPAHGEPTSDLPEIPHPVRTIGIGAWMRGETLSRLSQTYPEARFVPAERLLDPVRMRKEPEEIERLAQVAKLTDEVMMDVLRRIGAGSTQAGIMAHIRATALRMGADTMSFAPFCGFMRSGAGANDDIVNVSPHQGLEPGTAICFDVGFVKDGYASDWGRSVFFGKPQPFVLAAHTALKEAMLELVANLHEGAMRCCDVYPFLEKALDARGYGDAMRLRLADSKVMGHSIGVEVHENPWQKPSEETVFTENMVVAIEPKLWHPGEYYLRLEEIVWIRKNDAVFLTNFDRDLFEL